MNDDDRDFSVNDPAPLLPFVCELTASSPDTLQLPHSKKYLGEKASDHDSSGIRD